MHTDCHYEGRRQNFSGEGSRGLQGRAAQPFFDFQGGGGSIPNFCRFNGQNERIFGPGGPWPLLSMPAYAYDHYSYTRLLVRALQLRVTGSLVAAIATSLYLTI